MNQGIRGPGTSQTSGVPSIDNQLISPKVSYTPREKRGALNRHAVQRSVSTRDLIGMGAIGGLVGGTLAGVVTSGADFPWIRVAATSAIGATVFALGTAASVRPTTPLANAEAKLTKAEQDRACLLGRDIDNPAREFGPNEIYTIKRLSERYRQSWRTFKLLWDVLYSPDSQGNYDIFLHEIIEKFPDGLVNRQAINEIHEQMAGVNSLEEAMSLKKFKDLARHHSLAPFTCTELGLLMFTYAKITLDARNLPGGATPYSLYQSLCWDKYESFKTRLAQDESLLINDIRVLRAIADEQR